MRNRVGFSVVLLGVLSWCAAAGAQMVVHAVSGTVKAINPSSKTLDVTVESGDTSEFKLAANAKVTLDFDKALQTDATDATKFQKVGDFAVVYYYGFDDNRTAVAVKDLGAGPFEKVEGMVTSFDKHGRTMSLKDDSGKAETFKLSEHLVVDTGVSVEAGRGYDPHKGDHVRVTYTAAADTNTAVFLRTWQ